MSLLITFIDHLNWSFCQDFICAAQHGSISLERTTSSSCIWFCIDKGRTAPCVWGCVCVLTRLWDAFVDQSFPRLGFNRFISLNLCLQPISSPRCERHWPPLPTNLYIPVKLAPGPGQQSSLFPVPCWDILCNESFAFKANLHQNVPRLIYSLYSSKSLFQGRFCSLICRFLFLKSSWSLWTFQIFTA